MDLATVFFLLSAVTLLYVLFGYPLLLSVWPLRKNSIAFKKEPAKWRSVNVILPVRDGERWIQAKLDSLKHLDYPRELVQVLVISDGSTDNTEDIVRSNENVQLLINPGKGKSDAINHALSYATGEILFFTDVRQPLDRGSLAVLVACFDDPKVGVATGELVIRSSNNTAEENVGLYWRYEKWIRQRHSRIDSVLGATGAIYAIRRELVRPMPPHTLLDDVHIPMSAFLEGYRIVWAGEARAYDYPTALQTEFRRKVRTLAGVYQLIGRFPALMGPRNRMWIHFVSHKVGRLILPFALIGLFLSSIFLPWPWSVLFVGAQAGFYGLALMDFLVPEGTIIKRVTSIIRTFTVLMVAAFWGASILFRSSESFWKTPTKT
jgi:poly-beta-1,6-N-acetyl-D-glucosamine synthase